MSAFFSAAVTAFGLAVVTLLGSNAWTAPVTVIISAPALFISGAVWPLENLHWAAIAVSQLIPTTPGIFASAAAAQDGAELKDILPALAPSPPHGLLRPLLCAPARLDETP